MTLLENVIILTCSNLSIVDMIIEEGPDTWCFSSGDMQHRRDEFKRITGRGESQLLIVNNCVSVNPAAEVWNEESQGRFARVDINHSIMITSANIHYMPGRLYQCSSGTNYHTMNVYQVAYLRTVTDCCCCCIFMYKSISWLLLTKLIEETHHGKTVECANLLFFNPLMLACTRWSQSCIS